MSFEVHDAEVVGRTDKGIWVKIPDSEEDLFIPESQISDDSELSLSSSNTHGTLVITEWLAEQKDLL